MSDGIQVAAWTQHHHHPGQGASLSHLRSLSSSSSTTKALQKPARPVSKSISTPHLYTMATVAKAPALPARKLGAFSDEDGNTLPDPRIRAISPAHDGGMASPTQHPDLSNEVATLSNKLISAINHQTNLDDTLSATRHELEAARVRVRQLEEENARHSDLITRGILIQKSTAEYEKAQISASLILEKRQRIEAETKKKELEQEVEDMTVSLFEEAQKMVIKAKEECQKEHDIVHHKNDQLRAQLADTEMLLKSHQEQLAELKQVLEQLSEAREDQSNQTAPSTPGLSKFDSKDDSRHDLDVSSSAPILEPISPSYPTSFTHLLHPVLRFDLSAYDDFVSLLRMSKNVPSNSRVSSGSYGNIGLGLGLGGYGGQQPTNGSTSSLSTSGTFGSSPATPTTPASTVSSASTNGPNALTPLKDTKFYKRALAEDIEPSLRLDAAPGLSWLARRTVLNAVCDGNLVVEPMPTSSKPYAFACSLCGEIRKGPAHVRSHRFRTSENDNAQRYPLCTYCLGRVRATCDFLGFLRILKDGHWRADDEESERAAWEESVRLREQMFWCRMGGGVVPNHHHVHSDPIRSPRISEERKDLQRKVSEELERTGEIQPRDITPVVEPVPLDDTFKRSSTLKTSSTVVACEAKADGLPEAAQDATVALSTIECPSGTVEPMDEANKATQDEPILSETNSAREHTLSNTSLMAGSPGEGAKEDVQRLSITIPVAHS